MKTRRFALPLAAIVGLSALLVGGVARAQEDAAPAAPRGTAETPRPGKKARKAREYQPRILKQVEELGLSADQKAKIKDLSSKMLAERRKAQDLEGSERAKALRDAGKKFRQDVLAALTAEQKAELKEKTAAARRSRRSRDGDAAASSSEKAERKARQGTEAAQEDEE
jgi:Spy/CpxP family protein refolding chaperone